MSENEVLNLQKLEKEIKDLKEQNASQLEMYEMTTLYLKKLQEELKISEQKLLQTNKNLTDSINYAKHIQNAFTLKTEFLQKIFPDSFIFSQPKDIVSGDFVWAFESRNAYFLGAGDCTGHGVPGAILSIFVISVLNQAVSDDNIHTPAEILIKLDELMQKYLKKYTDDIKDSVEISLIKYEEAGGKLCFSGAKRPLIQVRKGEIIQHSGAKFVLGYSERRIENVENKRIETEKGDMLYMFSDGFADQFGGEKNGKFTIKRLFSLLQEASRLPLKMQYELIQSTFENWKGENLQTDDILLIGIRI